MAILERILGHTHAQVQELTRALQAQQAETVMLHAELRTAARATTTARAQAGGQGNAGSPSRGGVETRMLGKPDVGLCARQFAVSILAAEVVAWEADTLTIALSQAQEDASSRVY